MKNKYTKEDLILRFAGMELSAFWEDVHNCDGVAGVTPMRAEVLEAIEEFSKLYFSLRKIDLNKSERDEVIAILKTDLDRVEAKTYNGLSGIELDESLLLDFQLSQSAAQIFLEKWDRK